MLEQNRKRGLCTLSSAEKHLIPNQISPWRPLLNILPTHSHLQKSSWGHGSITELRQDTNLKQNCWNRRSVSKNIGHWQTGHLPIPMGLKQRQTCLSELSQSPAGWQSRETPGWLKDTCTIGIYSYKGERLTCRTDGCYKEKCNLKDNQNFEQRYTYFWHFPVRTDK